MKRIYSIVLASLIALTFGFTSHVSALDTTALDQKSAMGSTAGFSTIDPETVAEQSFIPGVNRLSYVNLFVGKMSSGENITASLKIYSFDRSQMIGETTLTSSFEPSGGIKKFDFEPDLDLKLKTRYLMRLEVVTPNIWLEWHHSGSDANTNPYSRGTAFYNEQERDWDFNFETWGYSFTPSAPYVPPMITEDPEAPTTTATKAVPSATIATPTELQAIYDESTKKVNLSWKASTTTDIDGYIISRSEDDKAFKDIGTVGKSTLLTADNTAQVEKTYYYQVKAYKGRLSSVLTNSVTVTTSTTVPTEVEVTNQGNLLNDVSYEKESFYSFQNSMLVIAGTIFFLLVILLAVLIYLRKKKNITLSSLFRREDKRK